LEFTAVVLAKLLISLTFISSKRATSSFVLYTIALVRRRISGGQGEVLNVFYSTENRHILECLANMLLQWTGEADMEILVIDNASTSSIHELNISGN
jgi:hypothetical protein